MRLGLWAWLLWCLPIWFVLQAGAFLVIGLALRKTVGELVGSYVAFVVPAVIFIPLVWWLRVFEEQGTSPKRLARGWFLSTTLFLAAVIVATCYSGIVLRLINPRDALTVCVIAVFLAVPTLYFSIYRRTLIVIPTRIAVKTDRASSK